MGEAFWIAFVGTIGVASGGFFGYLTGKSRTKFQVEQLQKEVKTLQQKKCPCDAVEKMQTNENELKKAVEDLRLDITAKFSRIETLLEMQYNRPHNERTGDN